MSGTERAPLHRRVLPFEWAAITVLLMLLAVQMFWIQIYGAIWIVGIVAKLLIWFVALLLAIGGVILAFQSTDTIERRVRSGAALPGALLLMVGLSGPALWLGFAMLGEWRLWRNGEEYAALIARAPAAPHAFQLMEGIPDGGVSLIYLPGRSPQTLTQSTSVGLVGERIRSCRSLRRDWHVCDFD